MTLLNFPQTLQMTENWKEHGVDHYPVFMFEVFLDNSRNVCYMLTELDQQDEDTAYGLCDLSDGKPEMGYISLSQIEDHTRSLNKRIISDSYFDASHPISIYAEAAREAGYITTNAVSLTKAELRLRGP